MKKFRVLGIVLLVAGFAAPGSAGALEEGHGTGKASAAVVRLAVGPTSVELGGYEATTDRDTRRSATSSIRLLEAAGIELGRYDVASSNGTPSRTAVGAGPFEVPGKAKLERTGGFVEAVAGDLVHSGMSAQIGSARALGSLFSATDTAVSSNLRATTDGVRIVTNATVADVAALGLGDLLRQMGSRPSNLACSSVEGLGAALSVPTAGTCAQVDQAEGLIDQARSALDTVQPLLEAAMPAQEAARTALDAQQDAVAAARTVAQQQLNALRADRNRLLGVTGASVKAAQIVPITVPTVTTVPVTTTISLPVTTTVPLTVPTTLVDGDMPSTTVPVITVPTVPVVTVPTVPVVTSIVDSLPLPVATTIPPVLSPAVTQALALLDAQIAAAAAHLDSVVAQLNALTDQLRDLDQLLADATSTIRSLDGTTPVTTCDTAIDGLTSTSALVPSVSSTLAPILTLTRTVCDALRSTLDTLSATALVSISRIDARITLDTTDAGAARSVSGTLGSVRIGGAAPLAVDVPIRTEDLQALSAQITAALVPVTQAILGVSPTIRLFGVEGDSSVAADRTRSAWVSTAVLRVTIPAGSLQTPSGSDLGVLGSPTASATGNTVRAAQVAGTPTLTLAAAVFDAAAQFRPRPAAADDPSSPAAPAGPANPGPTNALSDPTPGQGPTSSPGMIGDDGREADIALAPMGPESASPPTTGAPRPRPATPPGDGSTDLPQASPPAAETPADQGGPGPIAYTGSGPTLMLLGFALLALGAGLEVASKRRRLAPAASTSTH